MYKKAHTTRFSTPVVLAALVVLSLLNGCVALPPTPATTSAPAAQPADSNIVIYAPATPASVPILMAAQRLPGTTVTIFANHAQANAEFLSGDVDMLVTGLSVGMDLFENGAPVRVVNSYVAGLTYLVTRGEKVESFADLRGQEIYLPFEGSPIEQMTRFLAERDGLKWGEDIKPVYAPFPSSVELLKQGKATAVALPEPSVALVAGQPDIFVSLDYRALWDAATGSADGYPQVTPFIKAEWAAANAEFIGRFNGEVEAALKVIAEDPERAVAETQEALGLPAPVLTSALERTGFAFLEGEALAQTIRDYSATIGEPLGEKYDAFFYRTR
jgi:NitT/TauT family transport system substrate-binding protein